MTKIKLSYETAKELETVVKLLSPILKSYKVSKTNTGQFKKAYIELKS